MLESSYSLYRQKLEEAKVSAQINTVKMATVEILEEAVVPKSPLRPRPLLYIPFGILVGIIVSVTLLFILRRFEHIYHNPDDVRNHLGLDVLATIKE